MKRKIVQHGSSSLTITLPIKWVEKFNLKKGDELQVEESGTMLVVSTGKSAGASKKVVYTSDFGVFTKNNLSHLYQLGYDDVEIFFEDNETLEEIKKRIPSCIGFEIIDQKANKIYIKSIATTLESEFDTLLRKSFQITNEMAKAILEAFEKGEFEKLKEIRNMESLNNKFTDVCIRILNKRGYQIATRTNQIYEIVKNLERIADEFKYICDAFSDYDLKLEKEYINYYKEVMEYYLAFYAMFYKFDSKLKKMLVIDRKTIVKRLMQKLVSSKKEHSLLLHHLINIIQKTYEGAGGYFALVL